MLTLKELRTRLEEFPRRIAEGRLAGDFAQYSRRVAQAREKLRRAHECMNAATQVNANADYARRVLPRLKKAIGEAKRLQGSIEEDASNVQKRATESAVIRLGDLADEATTECERTWSAEMAVGALRWEKVAMVVEALGAEGGSALRRTVDQLKGQPVPKSKADVEQVQLRLNALRAGISGLGLEGAFGHFLEASAGAGASPRDLLTDEVRDRLEKHDLWDSFVVRLDG